MLQASKKHRTGNHRDQSAAGAAQAAGGAGQSVAPGCWCLVCIRGALRLTVLMDTRFCEHTGPVARHALHWRSVSYVNYGSRKLFLKQDNVPGAFPQRAFIPKAKVARTGPQVLALRAVGLLHTPLCPHQSLLPRRVPQTPFPLAGTVRPHTTLRPGLMGRALMPPAWPPGPLRRSPFQCARLWTLGV